MEVINRSIYDAGVCDICTTVFRNQWAPAYAMLAHVTTFPLGYKSGFRVTAEARGRADRPLLWSFAGHSRSDARRAMLSALGPLEPNRVHLSSGFDASNGLAQEAYRQQLELSLFAPCPSGFSTQDTFRFCEALEAGCIPIVERGGECDYYRSWLGEHSALAVLDWRQTPDLIGRVLAFGKAEQLRQDCIQWWDDFDRNYPTPFRRSFSRDVSATNSLEPRRAP